MTLTVVALLTLSAVTSHVAKPAAGVTGLMASSKAASETASLGAVTGDMAHFPTFITLLRTARSTEVT